MVLEDAAVAISGDGRHWVELRGRRLSHTMDPRHGATARQTPASVSVVAATCEAADAGATALMVLDVEAGETAARKAGLDVLFLKRGNGGGVGARRARRLIATGHANEG